MGKFTRQRTVDPGYYPGTHTRIEVKESKDGAEFNVWYFEGTLPDGSVAEFSQSSSLNIGPSSKGGKWAQALLGRRPTDSEIDDDLVCLEGLPCTLAIVVNPDTGYNAIDAVLPPARPLSDATVAHYAAEATVDHEFPY